MYGNLEPEAIRHQSPHSNIANGHEDLIRWAVQWKLTAEARQGSEPGSIMVTVTGAHPGLLDHPGS
jgi:hypothetical protein